MQAQYLTHGPAELRIRWEEDWEPYDLGDAEVPGETQRYIDMYGVCGCIIETRAPSCACCGHTSWKVAQSLWSIVGDDAYHREIERELIAEVAA